MKLIKDLKALYRDDLIVSSISLKKLLYADNLFVLKFIQNLSQL